MPETEESSSFNTLPRPELNPLLNPTLGQNLGRWAEVYYKSAPGDREQAVEELLQQLEIEQTLDKERPDSAGPERAYPDRDRRLERDFSNSPDLPSRADLWSPADSQTLADGIGDGIGDDIYDTSPLKSLRAETVHRQKKFASIRSAARLHYFLGGSALMLVGVLVVLHAMWRSTPPSSGISNAPPPAAMAHSTSPAPLPVATAVDESEQKPPQNTNAPADVNSVAVDAPARVDTPESKPEKLTRPILSSEKVRMPSHGAPAARTSQTFSSSDTGSIELALAKSYLSGSGRSPDRAEAARWLWKAVAKQNAEATGLLSELYLRGDGVPKSCEQARLLLDAAARKGVKGAGEQLIHLQAFGCN